MEDNTTQALELLHILKIYKRPLLHIRASSRMHSALLGRDQLLSENCSQEENEMRQQQPKHRSSQNRRPLLAALLCLRQAHLVSLAFSRGRLIFQCAMAWRLHISKFCVWNSLSTIFQKEEPTLQFSPNLLIAPGSGRG